MMKRLLYILLPAVAGAMLAGCGHREVAEESRYWLQPGDSIAVISPSALPDSDQVRATVAGLEGWGYKVWLGPNAAPAERTLDECCADMMHAITDDSLKAIFCIRGGFAAFEVMDRIPLDSIRRHPKPLIGYSDITACHAAWSRLGLPSLHASMSAAFTDLPEECVAPEHQMMEGQMPEYTFPAGTYHHDGEAEGRLIGGNLEVLLTTLNTPYDCTVEQPYILLLEDLEISYNGILGHMAILKHSGILDRASAIILGDWTDCTEMFDSDGTSRGGRWHSVEEMLWREMLGDLDIPICTGFPIGHGKYNYPLRLGAEAKLTVSDGKAVLRFPESAE